ncbi:MAG TPA: alpha/beta hydrolase-fold protein [Candidatus Dormibacteraeota bacterium]|nr:alpha/beta hydrolase-fold protein [Candidatus Dormibacteraeota bacterium]
MTSTNEAAAVLALEQLLDAAQRGDRSLAERIPAAMAGPSGPSLGPSAAVWRERFLFAASSPMPLTVTVDEGTPAAMSRVDGTDLWYRVETLALGATHNYLIEAGDGPLGGPRTVAGYGAGSYPIAGAPSGSLSEMRTITSRVYDGAESRCWVYANPGIDTARGAPVMVWLDGQGLVGSAGVLGMRMQVATDNLVHQGLIPPMVHVLLAPSTGGTRPEAQPDENGATAMRSVQYDTVSDEFGRYLVEEVLPEIGRDLPLRGDAYSRAIAGESSGGICSFKVCWFVNDQFSRALSGIGSFTALQWHPERHLDGGNIFPFLVRREERRNIRIWLSDGMNDLDSDSGRIGMAGSWPLANIQMAQSLKVQLYDFHFRYGTGYHSAAQTALDLPESLPWLWRGYDAERDGEVYEQEAEERSKPLYRVQIVNRDAW